MIDHDNTCKNIYVQYLTLTFISRSNLGQIPLKVTKQAHSDLRTLYVLVSLPKQCLVNTIFLKILRKGKLFLYEFELRFLVKLRSLVNPAPAKFDQISPAALKLRVFINVCNLVYVVI
jgi:hypothetical protein